jgi:hypothetical protein
MVRHAAGANNSSNTLNNRKKHKQEDLAALRDHHDTATASVWTNLNGLWEWEPAITSAEKMLHRLAVYPQLVHPGAVSGRVLSERAGTPIECGDRPANVVPPHV